MREMLPIIMNTNFEKLGIVDDYSSFIWSIRYYNVGDFELCADITSKNIGLFQYGYYVMRENDEHVGIIEDIKVERDEDMKETLIASGRFLSSILARRIIAVQTQVNGTVQSCIQKLLNENAINPSDSARQIPTLSFTSELTSSQTMEAQYTGKNLLDTISLICETYGYGYRTLLDDNNGFAFQLFEGTDRSYAQSENPYVIFSDEFDNLLSLEYEENYEKIVTDVLVAGEGEGLSRKTIWARNSVKSGLDRYEVYQDARNASTNNGEISDAVYYEQLRQEGLESLTGIIKAVGGTVYSETIEYGKDVFIGDICTIENTKWGIHVNSRLIEVIESINEAGEYSITPTFGDQESEV